MDSVRSGNSGVYTPPLYTGVIYELDLGHIQKPPQNLLEYMMGDIYIIL